MKSESFERAPEAGGAQGAREAQHTPGPWTACAGDDCKELISAASGKRAYFPHVHIGPSDHGQTYVSADGNTYPALSQKLVINTTTRGAPMVEHDANARLIAAAPELLEALERVAENAEGHAEWYDDNDRPHLARSLRKQVVEPARAAIAKARAPEGAAPDANTKRTDA